MDTEDLACRVDRLVDELVDSGAELGLMRNRFAGAAHMTTAARVDQIIPDTMS